MPIISYCFFPIFYVIPDLMISFVVAMTMVVTGFLLTWLSYEKRKSTIPKSLPQNISDIRRDNPVLILGAIYGIVAAFAITQALINFGQASHFERIEELLFENAINIILLTSFFLVAIPFYHGATVFLSSRAAELIHERKQRQIFFYFIMLFTEATFLFLMGISVTSVEQFVIWLFVLMIVDLGWTLVAYLIIRDEALPPEWIHLDFLTIVFLLIFVFLYPSAVWFSPFTLFIVLLFRTLIDYRVAWNLVYFRRWAQK